MLRPSSAPIAASLLSLMVVSAGCDGDSPAVVGDGGRFDAPTNAPMEGGVRPIDARMTTDLPVVEAQPDKPPPPPPNMASKAIALGRARLVGDTASACSNQVPAMGAPTPDRWCAFTLPFQLPGRTELWVVNVTKMLANVPVKCDSRNPTGDPNCKLLTTELWTAEPAEGPTHPDTHRFDGDTLVFHAKSTSTLDAYVGPIFAWRVGWPEARQLSQGNRAYTCGAHFSAEMALCIEDLSDTAPLQFNLTAGPLTSTANPTGSGLKTLARITPTRPGTQSSQWSVTFTRTGDYVLYSTGGTMREQVENLYLVKTSDITPTATMIPSMKVADNISRWRLSVDGKQIYYLKAYNYSTEGDPAGNLMAADFPTLANEKMLMPKVGLFQVLFDGTENNRGLGMFENVVVNKGNYKIMRDINMPTMVSTVATGVSSIAISRDLQYVYFSKEFDQGLSDAYVGRADGTGTPCTLTTSIQAALFGSPFTFNSSMVMWVDLVDRADGVGEGWYAPVAGCGTAANKKKFTDRVDYWFFYRDQGLIYSDDGQGIGVGGTATLKLAPLTGGGTAVGMFTGVQQQMSRLFAITPNFEAVIFSISGSANAASDGLYLYSMIPFVGARDGGAGN